MSNRRPVYTGTVASSQGRCRRLRLASLRIHCTFEPAFSDEKIMHNPRLRNGPGQALSDLTSDPPATAIEDPVNRFVHNQTHLGESLAKKFGAEWISTVPVVNPARILLEARKHPMLAAMMCQRACVLLRAGSHARVRELLTAAYEIALKMAENEHGIVELASEVRDGRFKDAISVEKIKDKLIHYLFIFIFAQSGYVNRNRATQWAQALQIFFDNRVSVIKVEENLKTHGQNALRKATSRLQALKKLGHSIEVGNSITLENLQAMLGESESSDQGNENRRTDEPAPTNGHDGQGELGNQPVRSDQGASQGCSKHKEDEQKASTPRFTDKDDKESFFDPIYEPSSDESDGEFVDLDAVDAHVQNVVVSLMQLGTHVLASGATLEEKDVQIIRVLDLCNDMFKLRRHVFYKSNSIP